MGKETNGKGVEPVPSVPPVTCPPIPELPKELWKIILGNLKDSYGSLLTCRLISKSIKSLADEVLKENSSLWKSTPTFEDFSEVLKKAKGVRFSTAEQVTRFISEMKGAAWNPFPNGTVVFCPIPHKQTDILIDFNNQKAYDDFYAAFSSLVSVYHEDISTLVYCFKHTMDHLHLCAQLEYILKLKNLKHLTIYFQGFDLEDEFGDNYDKFVETEKSRRFIPVSLSNVVEFQIMGEMLIMPYLGRVLCAAVNSSCMRLTIHALDCEFLIPTPDETKFDFPKLEMVKTSAVALPNHWTQLVGNCRNSGGLRQVSVQLEEMSANCMDELMKLLEGAAANLQMLSVGLPKHVLEDLRSSLVPNYPNPDMDLVEGDQPQFKKMKHLMLLYQIISKWKSLLPYCKRRFPNLRQLTIIVTQEDQGSRTPQEFHAFVMDLWKELPSSLDVIHVPYFFWSLNRAGSGSLSY